MPETKIYTNHHKRDILYGCELPNKDKWRKEHDWISEEDFDTHQFVMYRGWCYSLEDFMISNIPEFKEWDGYSSDSFFSGVLIKYPKDEYGIDHDHVIMGTYIS